MNITFSLQQYSLPSVKLRAFFSLIFSQTSCLCVVEPNSNNVVINCCYIPLLPILPDTSQTNIVNSTLKLPAQLSNNTLLLVYPSPFEQ